MGGEVHEALYCMDAERAAGVADATSRYILIVPGQPRPMVRTKLVLTLRGLGVDRRGVLDNTDCIIHNIIQYCIIHNTANFPTYYSTLSSTDRPA